MRLSTKISASVSLFLAAALLISAAASITREYNNLEFEVHEHAENDLSIFRALHIEAMLSRGDTLNDNPVIATLNGTMKRINKDPDHLALWVVMSAKVLAFQAANGLDEKEPPQDDIDVEALASGTNVGRMVDADMYRLTEPVILGQGDGDHKKCFECHGEGMGINPGEVIGVYSIALSIKDEWAHFMSSAKQSIFVAILISILISAFNVMLLNRMVSGPITRLTGIMNRLAGGETRIEISDLDRSDEIGDMTRTMVVFKDNAVKRLEAEDALRLAVDHAEVANRAKSEMLTNMSHELRTPLNAIIGFSRIMSDETFGPVGNEKYKAYLQDISNSGEHLLELINDILNVAAIESGVLELNEENIKLADLVDSSIRIIVPRANTGRVTVSSSIGPEVPIIFADERRVKQVMLNLLSNAVKFTPEGGMVSVSAHQNGDGSLAVMVTDNGIGMDEAEIETGLRTFGQVDGGLARKHEGTGLGLPLTKGLMELHGGTLRVESKKHHGTTVIVTFPGERVLAKDAI